MRWLLTVLIVGVLAWPSAARERVALVIGNGAYSHASALKNPVGDATAMAGALERLGFEVVLGTDLDMGQTTGLLHRFARQVREAEVVLFFYAGHGIQVDGENYVLPVDARMTELLDLEFEALAVERVLDQMRRASPDRDGRSQAAKIVLLDACRDNPFHESLARSVEATRSGAHVGRGLAEIRPRGSGGYLIGFATDPGDVAYDGVGAHSPYTAALLAHLETPGLEIRQVMQRVGRAVHGTTGARQQPWTVTSLNDPLYLAPGGGSAATGAFGVASGATGAGAAGTPGGLAEGRADGRSVGGGGGGEGAGRADTDETTLARDRAQWEAAEASGHLDDYRLYLDLNPDGAFAAFARARIARLERAATAPPAAGGAGPPGRTPQDATEGGSPGGAAGDALALSPPWPWARDDVQDPIGEATPLRPDPSALEAALDLDRAVRRTVQRRLSLAGHDPGGIDGVFGRATRSAIEAWQQASGLTPSGYLDADQIARLERETDDALEAWTAAERARRTPPSRDVAPAETYSAYAYCSMTGVQGYGYGNDRYTAARNAALDCQNNGGIAECCINGTINID